MKGKTNPIALIAPPGRERSQYRHLLDQFGVDQIKTYPSLRSFREDSVNRRFTGVIVDYRSLRDASVGDRQYYHHLCQGFRVLRIQGSPDEDRIDCRLESHPPTRKPGKKLLEYFIKHELKDVRPQIIRNLPRKITVLNAMIHTPDHPEPIRSLLLDISASGCYAMNRHFFRNPGETITIEITDLIDPSPIQGEICWSALPGMNRNPKLSGCGIKFHHLSTPQYLEIDAIPNQF